MSNDFKTIIDFIFTSLSAIWIVVVSNWILAFGVLLLLLNWIVNLINGSRQE